MAAERQSQGVEQVDPAIRESIRATLADIFTQIHDYREIISSEQQEEKLARYEQALEDHKAMFVPYGVIKRFENKSHFYTTDVPELRTAMVNFQTLINASNEVKGETDEIARAIETLDTTGDYVAALKIVEQEKKRIYAYFAADFEPEYKQLTTLAEKNKKDYREIEYLLAQLLSDTELNAIQIKENLDRLKVLSANSNEYDEDFYNAFKPAIDAAIETFNKRKLKVTGEFKSVTMEPPKQPSQQEGKSTEEPVPEIKSISEEATLPPLRSSAINARVAAIEAEAKAKVAAEMGSPGEAKAAAAEAKAASNAAVHAKVAATMQSIDAAAVAAANKQMNEPKKATVAPAPEIPKAPEPVVTAPTANAGGGAILVSKESKQKIGTIIQNEIDRLNTRYEKYKEFKLDKISREDLDGLRRIHGQEIADQVQIAFNRKKALEGFQGKLQSDGPKDAKQMLQDLQDLKGKMKSTGRHFGVGSKITSFFEQQGVTVVAGQREINKAIKELYHDHPELKAPSRLEQVFNKFRKG